MISVHPELIWTKPKPPAPTKVIDGVPVRRFAVKSSRTNTFRNRGGMSAGPTGGNGLGVVPRAYVR